jgi:hypothetical protein
MKSSTANDPPASQITVPAGGAAPSQPALLPYAAADAVFATSLPTRFGLIFAALVVPALLAAAGWGVPNRDRVRAFARAAAAVFGATAVVCCVVGYRRDRRSAAGTSRLRPWALATCLILAVGGIALGGGAALIRFTTRDYHYSYRHHCQRNLHQVLVAILMYASQNKDRLPDSLDDVLRAGDVASDVFICPVRADTPPRGGTIPYVYLGKGKKSDVGPDVVILHDAAMDHDAGMNFAYGDMHVEWHDPVTSKKILAKLNAGYNPPRPEKLK